MGVSFETLWRRLADVAMRRRDYAPARRRGYVRMRRHIYVAERRRGYVTVRRNWVFHLRRCGDVHTTDRATLLRRLHDVFLPGGLL